MSSLSDVYVYDAESVIGLDLQETRKLSFTPIEELYTKCLENRKCAPSEELLTPEMIETIKVVDAYKNSKARLDIVNEEIENKNSLIEKLIERSTQVQLSHVSLCDILIDNLTEVSESFDLYDKVVTKQVEKLVADCRDQVSKLMDEQNILDENISAMRYLLVTTVKELIPEEKLKSGNCPVCFETEANVCLVPCGHTTCKNCSTRLRGKCATCRATITQVVKLFYSF